MNNQFLLSGKLKRFLHIILLCCSATLVLQGCFPLMAGGAAGGTMAAADRRTLGAQTEDKAIYIKGSNLASRIVRDQGNVSVTSFNRKVLLTGEVRDEATKAKVAQEVAKIEHVKFVVNELEIAAPSSVASRSNDTWITGKVSASFVDAKDLHANSLKTVTERGVVYLMGRVTHLEGARAAEVASGVSGVLRVVKVFEYISEDELARLSSQPTPEK